jgi:hypothetical protein
MNVLVASAGFVLFLPIILRLWFLPHSFTNIYSRTPLIRIDWDRKPSGYAENPDNWIFL